MCAFEQVLCVSHRVELLEGLQQHTRGLQPASEVHLPPDERGTQASLVSSLLPAVTLSARSTGSGVTNPPRPLE